MTPTPSTPERDMSKAVVTDERVEAGAKAYYYACEKINEHDDVDGLTWEVPWEDVRDHYPATYEACIAAAKVVLSAALSHGAEALEPEQKPGWRYDIQYGPDGEANYAWLYCGAEMVATMRTYNAHKICERMNASPVRSAQEAVSDLDIQIAYEAWIDRTIGARAPITAFYAGYRAALLPPGGETATPDTETQQ